MPYRGTQEQMQQALKVDMEVLEDAGHINADSGFGEWRWMLEKIKGTKSL